MVEGESGQKVKHWAEKIAEVVRNAAADERSVEKAVPD
jgi:phosphoglucosamine mutase